MIEKINGGFDDDSIFSTIRQVLLRWGCELKLNYML